MSWNFLLSNSWASKNFIQRLRLLPISCQLISIIIYEGTRTGLAKAVGVAKALDIPTANIKANDGSYPTDTDITVVLGTDQAPKR